jgi:hypothetical protein
MIKLRMRRVAAIPELVIGAILFLKERFNKCGVSEIEM